MTPLVNDVPVTKFVPVATPARSSSATAGHGFKNNVMISHVPRPVPGISKPVCDFNQNILTDQFGNSVQVQIPLDQVQTTTTTEVPMADRQLEQPSVLTLESLRSNPLLQKLVYERVAILETK